MGADNSTTKPNNQSVKTQNKPEFMADQEKRVKI